MLKKLLLFSSLLAAMAAFVSADSLLENGDISFRNITLIEAKG